MKHARLEVIGNEPDDLSAHVEAVDTLHIQPIEKRQRRLDAGLLMINRSNPPVDKRRRRRLAKVVTHSAQHHGHEPRSIQIGIQLASFVDHHERVDPHVTFRMPFRLLFAPDERTQLGQQLVDDAEIQRQRQPA